MDPGLASRRSIRAVRFGVLLVGVSLGGFFDGVVLHQILEWHHLLSGVASISANLRLQLVADGFFHVLMYFLLAWGLVLLLRHGNAHRPATATTLGIALSGFAAWHILDAVLSHWVLGIHRIRMDVARPLAWDVAWLLIFGVIPLAIGIFLMRRRTLQGPPSSNLAVWGVVVLASSAAAATIWPAFGSGPETVTVVMAPGKSFIDASAELAVADARIIWMDPAGGVFVVRPEHNYSVFGLVRSGAIFISGRGAVTGCGGYVMA